MFVPAFLCTFLCQTLPLAQAEFQNQPAAALPYSSLYAPSNLLAWCIVPFDSKKRGPAERVAMLQNLGFKKYVYDWRAEHLPTFEEEVKLLQEAKITLQGVWFPAKVGTEGEKLLEILKKYEIATELWVMLPQPDAKLSQEDKVKASAELVNNLAKIAARQKCKIGIYNHGGWTGEPENMAAIAQACEQPNVGIVYNLHHGHAHVSQLADALKIMKPYLYAVNLNGMQKAGDQQGRKILVLGEGDNDPNLLNIIRDSGYAGPIGILGHTNDDAEDRLADNLNGLKVCLTNLEQKTLFAPGIRSTPLEGMTTRFMNIDGQTPAFVIANFPDALGKKLRDPQRQEAIRAAVKVYVQSAEDPIALDAKRVALTGEVKVEAKRIVFLPRFAPEPGLTYRLYFDPNFANSTDFLTPIITASFRLAKTAPSQPTEISGVFPNAKNWPENTLRMYVHFSQPMKRGDVYKRVHLLNSDGQEVQHPFLEIDEELWTTDTTRLTLLFDPGRVKRGLKPREEDGPILLEGQKYTLKIDANWPDATGFPLKNGFEHTFSVSAPDNQPIDPTLWKLTPPNIRVQRKRHLHIAFGKPLDHALIQRMIWITDATGKKANWQATPLGDDSALSLTPPEDYRPGKYNLVVDTRLEDLAGNRVGQPFEFDVLKPIQKEILAKTVVIPFEAK